MKLMSHFATANYWRFTWVRTPLSNGVRVTSVPTGLRYHRNNQTPAWCRCQRIRNPRKYISTRRDPRISGAV
jgi:hypothetical protein